MFWVKRYIETEEALKRKGGVVLMRKMQYGFSGLKTLVMGDTNSMDGMGLTIALS